MITIDNVWKTYNATAVLQGLNLKVHKGETLVILGRSGTGKSVLLKHIIGITKPDSGDIVVNGSKVSDLSGSKLYKAVLDMGMLFQNGALFDSMNIGENTAFFLNQHGNMQESRPYTEKEITEKVNHALELVGLSGTQKKMPSELSGGMKKRAALARLIVYRPSILLYDEPTTGLDAITSMQISELIVQTQTELDATSIVVTHDIMSALYIADRIALMENGQIVHIETPEKFMQIDHPTINFFRKMIPEQTLSFRAQTSKKHCV